MSQDKWITMEDILHSREVGHMPVANAIAFAGFEPVLNDDLIKPWEADQMTYDNKNY